MGELRCLEVKFWGSCSVGEFAIKRICGQGELLCAGVALWEIDVVWDLQWALWWCGGGVICGSGTVGEWHSGGDTVRLGHGCYQTSN